MADFALVNETIWPSQNDVASTPGGGKKMLENSWETLASSILGGNNFIVSGFALPGSSGTLNINVPSGTAMISGRNVSITAATTITATPSLTNHVYLKLTRDGANLVTGAAFEVNTTGVVPADSILIGTMVASASAITSTTDGRVVTSWVSTSLLLSGAVTQAKMASNSVGTGQLRTATGSASGSASLIDFTLNDYSFAENAVSWDTTYSVGVRAPISTFPATSSGGAPSDQVRRFSVSGGSGAWTTWVKWRYVTASDEPTIWVIPDADGNILASWVADDPLRVHEDVYEDDPETGLVIKHKRWRLLADAPIAMPGSGLVARQVPLAMLSNVSLPQRALDSADRHIEANNLKLENRLYRALQMHTKDDAPASWIRDACIWRGGEFREMTGQEKAAAIARRTIPSTRL